MARLDPHIRTRWSKDSQTPIPSLVERCRKAGLGMAAFTGHGSVHGAPEVRSDAHSAVELGRTFTEVPKGELEGTPAGGVRAVRAGRMVQKRTNPLLLMAPGYPRLRKVLA